MRTRIQVMTGLPHGPYIRILVGGKPLLTSDPYYGIVEARQAARVLRHRMPLAKVEEVVVAREGR